MERSLVLVKNPAGEYRSFLMRREERVLRPYDDVVNRGINDFLYVPAQSSSYFDTVGAVMEGLFSLARGRPGEQGRTSRPEVVVRAPGGLERRLRFDSREEAYVDEAFYMVSSAVGDQP